MAANLNCTREEVASWVVRDYIPNGWHLRLYLAATDLGRTVDRAVFELDGWTWRQD